MFMKFNNIKIKIEAMIIPTFSSLGLNLFFNLYITGNAKSELYVAYNIGERGVE